MFIDVGGPLYDDDNFLRAATTAVNELRFESGLGSADAQEVRAVYDAVRNGDEPSLRAALSREFLGGAGHRTALHERTRRHWTHPVGTLYADALPFLAAVAPHAVMGVLANQETGVIDALRRDGAGEFISVWGVSAVVGHEKPSRALFDWCLAEAGVDAADAIHIGNRFDNDVRPAHDLGLGTVWVLRGEAPDEPDAAEAALADLVTPGLDGVAAVLFP